MTQDDMALHPRYGLVQVERVLKDGAAIVWIPSGETAVVAVADLSPQGLLFEEAA